EPAHDARGKQDHQAVDHEQEDAKRQDRQREGNDLEEETERYVEKPDYQRGDKRRPDSADMKAGNDSGNNQQGGGIEEPLEEQSEHEVVSPLCGARPVSLN